MTYRPITDIWFLARAKLKDGKKYYGAYLGGFPERARTLIGASRNDNVLHVCGGMSRLYPYKGGFGDNDKTLDINPECAPNYLQDVRDPWPGQWNYIICDPPYSMEDANKYWAGADNYPKPNEIIKRAFEVLEIGGKVGILHYILPKCPKNGKFVAAVGIMCGFNNRIRCFSVFEKLENLNDN
jgi:hypothetical protein